MSRSFLLVSAKGSGYLGVFLWEFSILSWVVFLVDPSLFSYFRFQMMTQISQVSQSANRFLFVFYILLGQALLLFLCSFFLASAHRS